MFLKTRRDGVFEKVDKFCPQVPPRFPPRPKPPTVRGQAPAGVACRRRQKKYASPQSTPVAAAQPPRLRAIVVQPAARSVGASPASPFGGMRQHGQIQAGEQEQGEREHRLAHRGVYWVSS